MPHAIQTPEVTIIICFFQINTSGMLFYHNNKKYIIYVNKFQFVNQIIARHKFIILFENASGSTSNDVMFHDRTEHWLMAPPGVWMDAGKTRKREC